LPGDRFFESSFSLQTSGWSQCFVRQSVWVGVYGCILAGFNLGRILNSGLVLFLAPELSPLIGYPDETNEAGMNNRAPMKTNLAEHSFS
jgi:hypothetical protein